MHLCSERHGEVCHDEPQCPVCEKMEEFNEQEDQIAKLESRTLLRFHVTRDAAGADIVKHEYIEVQIRWPSGGEPGPRPDTSPTRWQLIEKQSNSEKPNEQG